MPNSREKGARGERELAKVLSSYGYHSRRGQQFSGANGDADVVGLPGIHIECKRVETLDLTKALEQSERDAAVRQEIPVVMHRKNRKPWYVTMRAKDFGKLIGANIKSKGMVHMLLSDWIELYQEGAQDEK